MRLTTLLFSGLFEFLRSWKFLATGWIPLSKKMCPSNWPSLKESLVLLGAAFSPDDLKYWKWHCKFFHISVLVFAWRITSSKNVIAYFVEIISANWIAMILLNEEGRPHRPKNPRLNIYCFPPTTKLLVFSCPLRDVLDSKRKPDHLWCNTLYQT